MQANTHRSNCLTKNATEGSGEGVWHHAITPEGVQNRSYQGAFQAWVFLLRRAANLNLREVADKIGVSPGRISQIQWTIEAEEPELVLARLKRRYKVKAQQFLTPQFCVTPQF